MISVLTESESLQSNTVHSMNSKNLKCIVALKIIKQNLEATNRTNSKSKIENLKCDRTQNCK